MQKSMSQEDRKGFEKMINMPGFSVEKFEEIYLLKKINPFVKSRRFTTFNLNFCFPGSQVTETSVSTDHLEYPCGKAGKHCGFSEMEEKLTQFLAKWEEVFEKFATQHPSTTLPAISRAVELQKKVSLTKL